VFAGPPPPGEHQRTALVVVEVAVSSHMIDRNVKARQYARAGVPTYWLVDVPGRTVEVRTKPGADGYERCDTYAGDAHLPSTLEDVNELDLAALFEGLGK
jgi:Uma2 family endonuclease